jgi:peptide/nickel transport system ATP-binding protein
MALLEVDALTTRFPSPFGMLTAVDSLSFSVEAGQTVAIVGESGSGKSVTAMSIMRLLRSPLIRHEGQVRFEERDLLSLPEAEMRRLRGNRIGMIFQEPMTALNPVETVGNQIAEGVRLHRGDSRRGARGRALDMLERVGIPVPGRRMNEYPHQLSGGMRQRVMIAMALACDPVLLIADEPTTALDVTVQAQILDLIREQTAELGSGVILITHDLGVVAELADRVVVVYAGRKVEEGTVAEILDAPRHPYTRGLLAATPRLRAGAGHRAGRMTEIPGNVPGLSLTTPGCAFASRCQHVKSCCLEKMPDSILVADQHKVACHGAQAMTI